MNRASALRGVRLVLLASGIVFVALAVGWAALMLVLRQPGWIDLAWNHRRYRAVVEAVRARGLPEGVWTKLRVDAALDPATLQLRDPHERVPRGSEVGLIWARQRRGRYEVSLRTVDLGHAGVGGYTFRDDPRDEPPSPQGDMDVEPGTSRRKLTRQWWAYFDNND